MMGGGIGELLTWAGRRGPLMLFGGVLVGLLAPSLADAARPLLGVAVFVFTLGAFLKVDRDGLRQECARPLWTAVMLAWTAFGVPLVMVAVIRLCELEGALAHGMILCMLAPPVGSAAAIAAMLGLSAPLALLATVAATIMSPFYLPPLATWLAGTQLVIDPVQMMIRLLLIVGGAGLAATLLRHQAGGWVRRNPHAMTGIAVLGLILVAVGAMRGMQAFFLDQPAQVARYLAIAFAVNAGFQLLGAAVFAGSDRMRSVTIGLVSGNRNVTLIWAAAGVSLADQPQVELFLAMSVFPIFMLPAITRPLVSAVLRPRAGLRTARDPRPDAGRSAPNP